MRHLAGVYFVKWRGYIKVGCAWNVLTRLRGLQMSIPEGDFEPLGWIPRHHDDAEEHESKIHKALAAHRVRGEWFADCPPVRRLIERYAKPWPEGK